MKKVNMLKKILSFSLALALFLTSPASVFAVDAEVPTVEAAAENNEGGAQETPVVTSEGENLKSDTLPAGEEQASESQSGSEDISGEDELNNGRAGSTDLGLEKAEGEAEEAEDADELTEAEAEEADACEHADFRYESNGDGTHKKICKDCDEVVAEAEPCEFDENGKCVLCGYEDPEHKFTLTDANGIVKVTGTKKVLNGATKVVATEITAEDDANDFKKMSDALDEEALKESKSVVDFVAYDITLYDNNDKEVKIQGDVNVVFTQLEVEGLVEDSYETEVYHYENESVDSMKQVETVSADTVQMVTNHFSTYIIAVSSHEDDRCYSSEYVNVYSWVYWSGDWYPNDWDVLNGTPDYHYYSNYDGQYNYVRYKNNTYYDFYELKVKIFVNGKQVNDNNQIVWTKYGTDSAFNVEPVEGYEIDSVKMGVYDINPVTEDDGYYFYTLADFCDNDEKVNTLEIYLRNHKTDAQFKVDLFNYVDGSDGNKYVDWPINIASRVSDSSSNPPLYMRNNTYNDGYACNKYYEPDKNKDAGKTFQGMPNQFLDENGMIKFSNFKTPNYFATKKYIPSKDDYYRDTDYLGKTGRGSNASYYISDDNPGGPESKEFITGYYNVGFPIQLNDKGYYVFDSDINTATFDSENGEIVIGDVEGDNKGFFPFPNNKFHFGMHFTTTFNMTKDGMNGKEPCVFEFSGDDDVWVYVDDRLVLDLGGIHGRVGGEINFATGACKIDSIAKSSPKRYGIDGLEFNLYKDVFSSEDAIKNNGEHTLQVYYLERGAGQSNLMMKFNLPVINPDDEPVNPLSFKKVDAEDNNKFLEGAKFTLVSEDGKYTALNDAEEEFAVSGKDGVVSFTKLKDSNGNVTDGIKQGVYILTEKDAPEGYALPEKPTWTVNVVSDNNHGSKFTISDAANVVGTQSGYLITNGQSTGEISTSVNKTAELINWDDRLYKITLDANATETTKTTQITNAAVDVVLVLDVSGSMDFPKSLTKVKNCKYNELEDKSKIYYFIDDKTGWVYALRHVDATWKTVSHWEYKVADDYRNNTGSWSWMVYSSYTGKRDFFKSDGKTRLEDAKQAACNFVDTVASRNEDSKVAVVTFNTSASQLIGLTKLNKSGVNALKNKINGIGRPDDGTNQYTGLKKASELLSAENKEKNAIVVITDGIQEEGSPNATVVTNAQNKATVYAVGMNLSYNEAINKKAMALLEDLASKDKSGNELAMNIGDQPLDTFLRNIADSINSTHSTGLHTVITDVIDPRFELVDQDGKTITSVTAKYYDDGENEWTATGTLSNDGTITWNVDTTNGFNTSFYVKAKDNFFGGNVIPTNGSFSGMKLTDVEGYDKEFPKPTVNVKLLDLDLADEETTVLLNDNFNAVDSSEAINFLASVDASYTDSSKEVHKVDNVFANSLKAGNNGEFNYSYPGTTDIVGTVKLTNQATGDTSAATAGDNVYTYENKVTYTPVKYDARNKTGINPPTDTTNKSDESKVASGIYKVNVVDAGIYGIKLGGAAKAALNGATYELIGSNGTVIKELTSADVVLNDKTVTGMFFVDGLGVGTYTVKEKVAPEGYALSNEVFTITIAKAQNPSEYTLTVSTNGNSEVSAPKTFSVLGAANTEGVIDTGYLYDVDGKKITSNNTTYLYNTNDSTGYTVVVKTNTPNMVAFSPVDHILYTLPETGGRGVYVYTIGGVLLMLGACLLLYKNKKNKNK